MGGVPSSPAPPGSHEALGIHGWDPAESFAGAARPRSPGILCPRRRAPGRPSARGWLGRLYLVTQDGYLHAYEADGRFRFSFTVTGTPLGSPSLRPADGAVLLGTTARSVYGIGSEGQLFFRAHTVTPVWSGLHARDAQSVVYIGLDRYLYALSNRGVALYRVPIPGEARR